MDRSKPPTTTRSRLASTSASTRLVSSSTLKRDSLAAELERDPHLSSAKRQQRAQAFTSTLAHANLERQLVAAQTAKVEVEAKLRDRDVQIERLERDRRWFSDREKEEHQERERERLENEQEKTRLETDLRNLRTSLSSLQEEYADLVDEHAASVHSHSLSEAANRTRISQLTNETTHFSSSLSAAQQLAVDRLHAISELQGEIEELTLMRDRSERQRVEEEGMGIVRQELQRQAGYLRELERTNAKLTAELNVLRERHTSVEVLREEKRALERRVQGVEEMRERLAVLEGEVEAARKEREAWVQNPPTTASNTPVTLTQSLSALRLTHAQLLEEHGSTTAQLRVREAELKAAAEREAEIQHRARDLEGELGSVKAELETKEIRTRLAEREVGFLKAMMASYALEQAHEVQENDSQPGRPLPELEELLEEYKVINQRLLGEVDDAVKLRKEREKEMAEDERRRLAESEAALSTVREEREKHMTTISTLTTQLKSLEEANDVLEQTLHDLRGEIAGGRYVPPGVRVLCLRENPESEWAEMRKEAVARVKDENEALMKRVRQLEALVSETGGGDGGGGERVFSGSQEAQVNGHEKGELVPRASWELVCREKEELEDALKQKEKRLLRLKQIFESKGAEFRDAIAAILGVKLAFFPNGNVRVTSVYDLTTSFVFQPMKAGSQGASMQLVAQGEGGPQDLPSLMEFWIEKEECIPGFMASVTLECYEYGKKRDAAESV